VDSGEARNYIARIRTWRAYSGVSYVEGIASKRHQIRSNLKAKEIGRFAGIVQGDKRPGRLGPCKAAKNQQAADKSGRRQGFRALKPS
jgi:hypothetical protein